MTDWVPGDWGTIKTGMSVRIKTDNGSLLLGTSEYADGIYYVATKAVRLTVMQWKNLGWNLFVPVPTQPELPTVPGFYTDKERDLWILNNDGEWECVATPFLDGNPRAFAPFTRLLPEAETAKRIAVELRNRSNGFAGGCHTVAPIGNAAVEKAVEWIAAEFGVSFD